MRWFFGLLGALLWGRAIARAASGNPKTLAYRVANAALRKLFFD